MFVHTAFCLECHCYKSFAAVDSECPDNTCSAAISDGFCYAEFTVRSDGGVDTNYICGRGNTIVICDGNHNSRTKYYECCNRTDLCNQNIANPFEVTVPTPASTGPTSGLTGLLIHRLQTVCNMHYRCIAWLLDLYAATYYFMLYYKFDCMSIVCQLLTKVLTVMIYIYTCEHPTNLL